MHFNMLLNQIQINVILGVPQRSYLNPLIFSIFNNDILSKQENVRIKKIYSI